MSFVFSRMNYGERQEVLTALTVHYFRFRPHSKKHNQPMHPGLWELINYAHAVSVWLGETVFSDTGESEANFGPRPNFSDEAIAYCVVVMYYNHFNLNKIKTTTYRNAITDIIDSSMNGEQESVAKAALSIASGKCVYTSEVVYLLAGCVAAAFDAGDFGTIIPGRLPGLSPREVEVYTKRACHTSNGMRPNDTRCAVVMTKTGYFPITNNREGAFTECYQKLLTVVQDTAKNKKLHKGGSGIAESLGHALGDFVRGKLFITRKDLEEVTDELVQRTNPTVNQKKEERPQEKEVPQQKKNWTQPVKTYTPKVTPARVTINPDKPRKGKPVKSTEFAASFTSEELFKIIRRLATVSVQEKPEREKVVGVSDNELLYWSDTVVCGYALLNALYARAETDEDVPQCTVRLLGDMEEFSETARVVGHDRYILSMERGGELRHYLVPDQWE